MKAIKENWKLVLIVVAGIVAVIFMCIFGIQGAQNKAFALEEQVNTADSDIKSIFNITPEELQKAMDVKLQRERNKQR